MRFYSRGDCNSHQTKAEKKKICDNWCVYQSSFSPPILLTSFVCIAVRNVRERTGSGTRVRLNARTTAAVHSHSQYDIPAPPLTYESQDSTECVLLLLVSFAPRGFYAVYMHALRLLYILVPYMCDVSRLVSVLLCYAMLYQCMRSPCLAACRV